MLIAMVVGVLGLTITQSNTAFAAVPTKEQELATLRKELEIVKSELKRVQIKKQEQIRGMTVESKKHVANTMLNMYRAVKKYEILEKEYEKEEAALEAKWGVVNWQMYQTKEYKELKEKYIKKYEEFTGIKTGETTFIAAHNKTINILKLGRGANLDALDREEERLVWAYQVHKARIKQLESGVSEQVPEDNLPVSGPLELRASQTQFEVAVGEVKLVLLEICGGKPPYKFSITSLSGENGRERPLESPARLNEPFSFTFPGMSTMYLVLKDSSFPQQETSLNLVFRVIGEEPEEEEAVLPEEEEPGESEKKEPKETPEEKKPPKKPAPIKPLIGTYRAELWVPGLIEAPGGNYVNFIEHGKLPIPLTLTFNANGDVSGYCKYECPNSEFKKSNVDRWTRIFWETSFQIDGSVDWKTGKIQLRIPNGKIECGHENDRRTKKGGSFYQAGEKGDYEADLIGWHLSTPIFEEWLRGVPEGAKNQGFSPDQLEKIGDPNVVVGPDGKYRFKDYGWKGDPIQPGSTGQVRLLRYIYYSGDEQPDIIDWLPGRKDFYDKCNRDGFCWYLKIVGPAVEEPEEPEEVTGELCGFAVWPESPVRLTVGQAEQFQAMGVFLENVFDAVDLSGKVKWEVLELKHVGGKATWVKSNALEKLRIGKYQANRPGTFYVRAWTRNKGDLFSDAIEVKVGASSAK